MRRFPRPCLLLASLAGLSLLACSGSDKALTASGDDSAAAALDDTAGEDTGPPCTPLEALFFDLGGTLVLEGDDGLFDAAPGAEELLTALTARELPLGVITNVPEGWGRPELEALLVDPTILDAFEVVLLSSEATASKPDPAIFTEAVGLLAGGAPAEHTAFVTEELDHLADAEPPTEGARAAGMIGVHLSKRAPSELADHTVSPDDLAGLASAPWVDCIEANGG